MQNVYASAAAALRPVPGSFYDVVDALILAESNPEPLRRILSLIRKLKAKSYLAEELAVTGEIAEEREDAERRCKGTVRIAARRLTFFTVVPKGSDWQNESELPNDAILGYVVVSKLDLPDGTNRCYVLEAVVRPPALIVEIPAKTAPMAIPVANYYIHNTRQFTTSIGTAQRHREFQLRGSYFAQQNDLTGVCAHAALRMAVNSSELFGSTKLTTREINRILKIDLADPKSDLGHYPQGGNGSGLTQGQLVEAVRGIGGEVISADFVENAGVEYDEFLYPFVEAGCPVVLQIDGWDFPRAEPICHVVAVLGHTWNSDRWEPEARRGYGAFPIVPYTSASAWADHYIIGDDNFGLYHTLPSDMLRNRLVPHRNPELHAAMGFAVVPTGVTCPGYRAEQLAVMACKAIINGVGIVPVPKWLERLREYPRPVCRTLLIRREAYREHLQQILKSEAGAALTTTQEDAVARLPEWLWLSEFSLTPLHTANKRKLGDVVVAADVSEASVKSGKFVSFAWFPGFVRHGDPGTLEPWGITGHAPFVRHDVSQVMLEW